MWGEKHAMLEMAKCRISNWIATLHVTPQINGKMRVVVRFVARAAGRAWSATYLSVHVPSYLRSSEECRLELAICSSRGRFHTMIDSHSRPRRATKGTLGYQNWPYIL